MRALPAALNGIHYAASQIESELVDAFFQAQPLLFEPNHVFSFGFIDYQERLRPRYQHERLASRPAGG